MTDVPRRAYPLVVAAPGGFEDAVRRGRGLRRRRTGGSAGAALALVGVVAYAGLQGDTSGPKGLHPATQDPPGVEQPAPGIVALPTLAPPVTGSPAPSSAPESAATVVAGPTAEPGTRATSRPATNASPPAAPGRPTTRPTARAYAARADIHETGPEPNTAADCLPEQGKLWCGRASATPVNGTPSWDLRITFCRRSLDETSGTITFDRKQEAEYAVVDQRSGETIWTYSAGQRVVPADTSTDVPTAQCSHWTTRWDGYDDFGLTPRPGTYLLVASSTGRSDTVLPTDTAEFTIGDSEV